MAKKLVAAAVLVALLFGGWYAMRTDEDAAPTSEVRRPRPESTDAANRRRRAESEAATTAEQPAPAAASDAAAPEVVAGVVVDPSGAPVADAEVYAFGARLRVLRTTASPSGLTDAAGRFELTASRFPIDVVARKALWRRACAPDVASTPKSPLRIVLEPGERIAGRVTDADGRSVERALVRALGPAADPDFADPAVLTGRSSLDASWDSARTDADGRYVLGGLAVGETLSVEVRKNGMCPDFDTSLAKTVAAGSTGVDFVLDPVHVARLEFIDAQSEDPVPNVGMAYLASGVELSGDAWTREWYVDSPDSAALERRRGVTYVQARIKKNNPESSRPRIHVTASAPGYEASTFDIDLSPAMSGRIVRLTPTAAGFGDMILRLHAADGGLVADSRLDLLVTDDHERRYEFFGLRVRHGAVRIDHVPAGRLHVERCDARGMTPTVSDFDGAFDGFDLDVARNDVAARDVDVRPPVDRVVLVIDVTDELAEPLSYATVAVLGASYMGGSPSIDVDAPLAHHVLVVPPGAATVTAEKLGFVAASQRVEGAAGDRIAVRLALRKLRR